MSLLLLIGGARSGKSTIAQSIGEASVEPVTFIATAEGRDEEMAERIRFHRAARPSGWRTVEEPVELIRALGAASDEETVILDCLTLWISNLLEGGLPPPSIEAQAKRVADAARSRGGTTVVVTNEVGLGIVPADRDTRTFRDLLGRVNATFASVAEQAGFVVAGRVLPLLPANALTELRS